MVETMPIAVVGMAARVPGAPDYHRFWDNLLRGVDSIAAVPADRWQAGGPASEGLTEDARRAMGFGGFIDGLDLFDTSFFGIAAPEAAKMDPKQRLALESAWRTMEDAGLTADDLRGTETGVFIGTSVYDYYELLMQDPRNVDGYVGVGNFNCIVPNRISYLLDLQGPSMAIETACSASMTALHLACQSIRTGECDQAFAGGAMVMLSPYVMRNFASGNFLSPQGRCHAFGAEADGYVRGEGAGMVLLKPLSAAEEAGDHVHAIILATACNQDGRSNGLTAPNPLAQERLLRRAYANAGVAPAAIGYVEAHGTGTPLGDPIEAKALGKVFGNGRDASAPCFIGSVKSNIGHLEAAAGIVGFIKTVLAVKHGVIPATLHAETINPRIDLPALKLAVPTTNTDWSDEKRRMAGVSSFSFGGSNVHAVVADARAFARAETAHGCVETLILSARSAEALDTLADRTVAALRSLDGDEAFAAFCSAAARGRKAYRHRLAVVAADAAIAATLLERRNDRPAGVWRGEVSGRAPKIVLAFSGQGLDLAGAGADLCEFPAFRDMFATCEAAIAPHMDVSLAECLWGSRTDLLADTRYAQPASLALSLSLHALWRAWGIDGTIVLGHSLGEYAAAVAADVYSPGDAMRLVAARGLAMASMEPGGMIALRCTPSTARAFVEAHPSLSVAAENAQLLTVMSGPVDALAALETTAATAGVATQRLPADRGFHSRSVDPVLPMISSAVDAIESPNAPAVKLVSNVTAAFLTVAPDAEYWARHARQPVRFAESLTTAREAGGDVLLEIGPGRTLCNLARVHPSWLGCDPIASLSRSQSGRSDIAAALAQLFVNGANIDWDEIFTGGPRRHDALPGHPFMRTRHWFEHADRRNLAARDTAHARHWLIDGRELDLLRQHVLNGDPVMPGASIIGYMLETVRDRDVRQLSDLTLIAPVKIPSSPPLRMTIDVEPIAGSDRWRIQLIGEDGTLHARAFYSGRVADAGQPLGHPENGERPGDEEAVERRYASLARQGIGYGPLFRTLSSLSVAGSKVIATVSPSQEADVPRTLATAALLDGCFQALGQDKGERAYIPVHVETIDAIDIAASPASIVACIGMVDGGDAMVADLDISDRDGRPAMQVRGLRLQAVGPGESVTLDRSMLLLPSWREIAPSPSPLPDRAPDTVVAELASEAAALAVQLDLSGYAAALDRLDRRAARAASAMSMSKGEASTPHGRALVQRFARMSASVEDNGPVEDGADDPATLFEARTLTRCIAALPDVLAGHVDPLVPLFDGDGVDVTGIYEDVPPGRYFNALCGVAIRSAAEAAGRRLRVLEVGAGTCATTRAVLAAAPDHLDYRISDYAPSFVAEAAQTYRNCSHVSAMRLDLETDFESQGLSAGSMDVAIAANVLHATADLLIVLKRLHRVLAPGGSLLIVELTHPRPWLDLTFGLTPGWWRFTDDRMIAGHPLIDRAAWLTLLAEAGFEAAIVPAPEKLGQDMIVARKPRTDDGWHWTVSGTGALRDAVADEAAQRMSSGASDRRRRALLHFVADDDAVGVTESIVNAARQALLDHSDRLVLVTAAAQTVGPCDVSTHPSQAAAFGVARSLALENPDLDIVAIDIGGDDHAVNPTGLAASICDISSSTDGEDERAIRNGRHYVPRLTPGAPGRPVASAGLTWRMALDGGRFSAVPAAIPTPHADEIVVRVDYSALNFLDVLEASDALPFARPDGPGEECVGTVVAIGAEVTQHRVGDRVMGIARGALASHVSVPAVLMVRVPDAIASRDAATAPVAYATAIHALRDIAQLTAGQRVLVHSGASGTGLAAVRYALSVGATVFATASPAKWPILRDLGVAWVGSSRTTAFSSALRAAGLEADIILNSLTGEGFVAASLDCLAEGGTLLELAKRDIWTAEAVTAQRPDAHYSVVDLYRVARERPSAVGAVLGDVAKMLQDGQIAPLPERVFPVDEIQAAVTTMRHGAHVGKVVIDCREGSGFAGSAAAVFDPSARYLVTGAFGGLGRATVDWMVDRGARIFLLAGRNLDSRAHDIQRRLVARGCDVDVVEADLADPEAARRLAERASADGRLRGAIHAPGVLADGSILNLTRDQILAVAGPKVFGAKAMADHWIDSGAARKMDFFVLFSSAASLIGSPGQASHAAANAVLDAAAPLWRARGLRTISINWGAWSQIGSARDAMSFVASRGMMAIAPEAGLAALDWAMRHDYAQIGVVPIDRSRWHLSNRPRPIFADIVKPVGALVVPTLPVEPEMLRATLATAIPSERRHRLSIFAKKVVADALGHGEATLDFDRGFTDLGVDSLTAIAIRNRLQRELDCVLGTTFLFDYPNIAVLVDTLDALIAEDVPSDDRDPLSDLAARLQASLDELDMRT